MGWKNWFFISFSLLLAPILSQASIEASQALQIGFISKEDAQFFEQKVKPYWSQLNLNMPHEKVEIVQLTPFDSQGHVELSKLAEKIQKAPNNMKTFYVHWNEKYDSQHEDWVKALRIKTEEGARVAFFAGLAYPGSRNIPLRQTIAARVPKALILGELAGQERLPAQHFYGPELFSAFQDAQAGNVGLSPLLFVSRWASYKPTLDLSESLEELRRKKSKSLRMWPTTEDFFGK